MNARCICPGAVCTCGAEGIVKDGFSVRRSVMAIDGAIGGEKHLISDAERAQARSDAYRDHMIEDVCRTSGGVSKAGRPVVFEGEAQRVYDAALAEAKAAGADDGRARTHAAYEAMKCDQRNAWRGA